MFRRPGQEPLSSGELLERFGAQDGPRLGLELLSDALARRDPIDVELALVVCNRFDFSNDHLEMLFELAFADWHQKHEDVAWALNKLNAQEAVDALLHLAQWVPGYLEFDDARALATKAIWALGSIKDPTARDALEHLTHDENEIVSGGARAQLAR